MVSRAASLSVLLAVVGCAASDDEAPWSHRPFTSEDSVVAIVSPNNPSYVCSGEVIGPRTILSAAHCFRGGNHDKTGWTFEIVIAKDAHHPSAADGRVPVVAVHLHPDYVSGAGRADGVDADIAVAIVDRDLTVPILPFATSAPPASVIGAAARFAGYGAVPAPDRGTRHTEPARIEAIDAGTVRITAARNPCHGDSGGPILANVDGVETILGVGHVAYVVESECEGGADYTRTDVFAGFLREHLR